MTCSLCTEPALFLCRVCDVPLCGVHAAFASTPLGWVKACPSCCNLAKRADLNPKR